jgi:hypothetical protein
MRISKVNDYDLLYGTVPTPGWRKLRKNQGKLVSLVRFRCEHVNFYAAMFHIKYSVSVRILIMELADSCNQHTTFPMHAT